MGDLGARPGSGVPHFTHIPEVRKQFESQTLLQRSWKKSSYVLWETENGFGK